MTFALKQLPFVDYCTAAMEDRSAERYKFEIAAQLRPSGVTGFRVVVTNLSLSGFACDTVSGIPVGARCWLTLPGLAPLQAEVVRNDGRVVGCAFTNLLSQIVMDSIVRQYGIAQPNY
jgi:hypothetical protein